MNTEENTSASFVYDMSLTDKNYKFSRFICPACGKRYGKPEPDGYMDVIRCDSAKCKPGPLRAN